MRKMNTIPGLSKTQCSLQIYYSSRIIMIVDNCVG